MSHLTRLRTYFNSVLRDSSGDDWRIIYIPGGHTGVGSYKAIFLSLRSHKMTFVLFGYGHCNKSS